MDTYARIATNPSSVNADDLVSTRSNNMREIKFRVFFKDKKVMLHFDGPLTVNWEYGLLAANLTKESYDVKDFEKVEWTDGYDANEIEVMQFTGLLDKNGKEIYERDYLGSWCVFWGSGKYILHHISSGEIIDCNENTAYGKEVSGNQFETPREHTAMASDL